MAHWPNARQWLFSLKAFVAAMLALYVALSFGLTRPYWAMATVYFVANPLTGATRSKAAYRVAGTVLGAAAAVITVPLLVNMPIVLTGAIGLWIVLLVYLSLLQRSPRSYVFLLAAYTLPIVALPTVMAPADVFDIAVSRVEEIVIGIVCASLVGAIVFPARVAPALRARAQQWLDDAEAWARDIAAGHPRADAGRYRLATDMLALDQMIEQLSFDTESRGTVARARALRARMSSVMPVLAALDTVLHAKREGSAVALPPAALETAVARLRARHEALMRTCVTLQRGIGDRADAALGERDGGARAREAGTGEGAGAGSSGSSSESEDAAGLHHDHGMLLFHAASAGLAVFCVGMLWILSGWQDGGGPVALSSIACCFFATVHEPRPVARLFIKWGAVCATISLFFLFVVLPYAQTFEALTGLLALPYVGIGALIARPGYNVVAMLLAITTASFTNVQSIHDANFIGLFNTYLANAAALLFAPLWAMLVRPFGSQAVARRLIRASWHDLARAATWRAVDIPASGPGFGARMLDRLGQLMPRLGATRGKVASDGFAELQIGFCTMALQRALPSLRGPLRKAVRRVLAIVARHFHTQARTGSAGTVPPALQTWIHVALAEASQLRDRELAASVESALVVLGVTLGGHETAR
ncbi:FUSC family protein [Cupriavidus plantarum]|uniref:Putative membrane protein YccC n=1 Tax=Cupriavidus plantarum TaxID=942865 RepID=A0A316EZU6_9BURK|nr:FUSC family protein [Cupriavidus plantarum]PWK37405.1 putative membrane protein YccC [Cupriavidus plantarum]